VANGHAPVRSGGGCERCGGVAVFGDGGGWGGGGKTMRSGRNLHREHAFPAKTRASIPSLTDPTDHHCSLRTSGPPAATIPLSAVATSLASAPPAPSGSCSRVKVHCMDLVSRRVYLRIVSRPLSATSIWCSIRAGSVSFALSRHSAVGERWGEVGRGMKGRTGKEEA
jgi:hypothetical protein